ncbi:hypothetical protein BH23CHL7_BH23CHL7_18330 [soil metagenome]
MNHDVAVGMFDYMYWVNHRLLDATERLPPDQLAALGPTSRDLRATLVHELDVEWSWRLAIQGTPIEELGDDVELRADDYPDIASIREHWARDEAEMRDWLSSLTDAALEEAVTPSLFGRPLPLREFLLHILYHAAQQQADAATLLTAAGGSPGEIGYLEYLASTGPSSGP